jgi:hypothetical protein
MPRDPADDKQSQAGALYALAQALVDAVEAAKDPIEFTLRNTLTLVGDSNQQIGSFVQNFNGDDNLFRRILDGVLQQIAERNSSGSPCTSGDESV